MRIESYVETPWERRRRIGLENAIKRRTQARYAIEIHLAGPSDGKIYPKVWLAFQFPTADEAWGYMEKINPMKFFPAARSASVECVRY